MLHVTTARLNGTTLVGRARDHVVLSDRSLSDGGRDVGCTSGELMLLAIGSCVVGNLNMVARQHGTDVGELSADVHLEPPSDDSYGAITVDVVIGSDVPEETLASLRKAAGSGRVTGRFSQNSEVRIDIRRAPQAQNGNQAADEGLHDLAT